MKKFNRFIDAINTHDCFDCTTLKQIDAHIRWLERDNGTEEEFEAANKLRDEILKTGR